MVIGLVFLSIRAVCEGYFGNNICLKIFMQYLHYYICTWDRGRVGMRLTVNNRVIGRLVLPL